MILTPILQGRIKSRSESTGEPFIYHIRLNGPVAKLPQRKQFFSFISKLVLVVGQLVLCTMEEDLSGEIYISSVDAS